MSRDQMIFGAMFDGQPFGPRNGFNARPWQEEAHEAFLESLERHESSESPDAQHRFTLYAGPGAGKTKASAIIASWLLNEGKIGQVFAITPNSIILDQTRKDFASYFGINLAVFNSRTHAGGIGRDLQGGILNYSSLIKHASRLHRITSCDRTLIIFDEIHHLGRDNSWGEKALAAFGHVPYVLPLTGTPWRTRPIPFAPYQTTETDGILRFSADPLTGTGYTYPLGRAIIDCVCRDPFFSLHRGVTRIRFHPDDPESEWEYVRFDQKLDDYRDSIRLRGAVCRGSSDRRNMLRHALQRCREDGRKVVIFLGGDTESDMIPTEDALAMPAELHEDFGIPLDEIEVVVGDGKKMRERLRAFGPSKKWVLVTVNLVSEGVDIPELSAAIFLTTVTAIQTTIQRIGRVLRLMGMEDGHKEAWIFMFGTPANLSIAEHIRIEKEIAVREKTKKEGCGGRGETYYRPEAIGVGDGAPDKYVLGGKVVDAEVVERARAALSKHNLPASLLEAVISSILKG